MKRIAMVIPAAVAALLALPAAHAATVTSLIVTGGSFTVFTNQPDQPGTNYAFPVPGGNLIAGPVDPILTFDLVDPFNTDNSGRARGYTTAASSATVDEAVGKIQLAIPTFRWDWDAPIPCLPPFADCNQPQQPQSTGGIVTGDWDSITKAFSVTWDYQWMTKQHPFPTGLTRWTLQGIATTPPPEPIPEPATYGLLAAGLVALAALSRRRERHA